MLLRKWSCCKTFRKFTAFFILSLCCGFSLSAQDIIKHTVEAHETLYKLSVLYNAPIDSIKAWNGITSESYLIKEGSTIIIKDYYDLEREELQYNLAVYEIKTRKTAKTETEIIYKEKIKALEVQKAQIDQNKASSMQEFFKIAKLKKLYTDSIPLVKDSLDIEIAEFEKKRDKWDALFAKKYPKKYKQRQKLWAELDLENNNSTSNTGAVSDAKEDALAKAKLEEEKLAKEKEALQKKEEAEALAIEKAKKEKALAEDKQLQEAEEKERLAQELEDAKNKEAWTQTKSEEDLLAEIKKEEEANEALAKKIAEEKVKAKKLEEEEAARIKLEIEAALKEEEELQKKFKARKDSIVAYEDAQETLKSKKLSPVEQELAAMEAAKKKAKEGNDAKIPEEVTAELKKNKNKFKKETEEEEIETLIFDVSFEENRDTTSKKYKKQQEKLEKEIALVEESLLKDSIKVAKSITVKAITVQESKKKKKLKMGDEVDEVRQEKARFFLSRAKMEIDKGNFKNALDYTSKSLDLNPNYTEAYMLKADMLASLAYYDKAYDNYEKANMLDNTIPQLHYNMGNCLIFLDRKQEALAKMGDAIKVDPEYILAYAGRSALYIELKKYRSALNDYNKILEINKYFYPALKGRGVAQLNLGNYEDAIRDFNELLEYEPEDASVYYNRGMAKMYLSKIYGACMDFLSASERGYGEADKAMRKYCD